jgi:hypothetical protein
MDTALTVIAVFAVVALALAGAAAFFGWSRRNRIAMAPSRIVGEPIVVDDRARTEVVRPRRPSRVETVRRTEERTRRLEEDPIDPVDPLDEPL